MLKRILHFFYENLLIGLLLLFFLTEAWSVLQIGFEAEKSSIPKGLKLLSLIGMMVYLFLKERKKFFYLSGLILCFLLGLIGLKNGINKETLISFSKYLFFLVLIIFFSKTYLLKFKNSVFIFKLYEVLILINCFIILISFVFQIEMFMTYDTHRFGYIGLFYASATGTYFYLLAISYFLIKYEQNVFYQPLFYLNTFCSLLVGTKSIYLFLVVSLLAFSLFLIKNKTLKRLIIFLTCLSAIIIFYVLFTHGLFSEILKEEGWLTSILSYRDQLIINRSIPYIENNWHFHNYLFGGLAIVTTRPQMELIDLFLFFGVLGLVYYLFIFKKYFFDFQIHNIFITTLLVVLAGITLIAGNFFYNASVPIYLVILKLAIIKSQEKLSNGAEYP